jgi:hypothetical protein
VKKTPADMDTLLVRLFCVPHGNVAGTVVAHRDGLELKTLLGVHSNGVITARSVAISAESELLADQCAQCGPISVSVETLVPLIAEARKTGKPTRLRLP